MNELSNIDSMSNADIMAAIGQSKGTNLPLLPKLSINREATDDEGNQLPVGVFRTYDTLTNCLKILNEILNNFSPNKKNMLNLAEVGFITATDLADYLVRKHSMTFRQAYQKTALIVNMAEKKSRKLRDLTIVDLKKIEPKLTEDVFKVFDLKYSVNSKKSYGGTSFDNIKKMIVKYKKKLWQKNYVFVSF